MPTNNPYLSRQAPQRKPAVKQWQPQWQPSWQPNGGGGRPGNQGGGRPGGLIGGSPGPISNARGGNPGMGGRPGYNPGGGPTGGRPNYNLPGGAQPMGGANGGGGMNGGGNVGGQNGGGIGGVPGTGYTGGLPLDPYFVNSQRLLEDNLARQQALLAPLRAQIAAQQEQQSARLNTNEGVDRNVMLEQLAGRGALRGGVEAQDRGQLATDYLRMRQDLANQIAGQYSDVGMQEGEMWNTYNNGLIEALLNSANRSAMDPYSPIPYGGPNAPETGGGQGGGQWQPSWQPGGGGQGGSGQGGGSNRQWEPSWKPSWKPGQAPKRKKK